MPYRELRQCSKLYLRNRLGLCHQGYTYRLNVWQTPWPARATGSIPEFFLPSTSLNSHAFFLFSPFQAEPHSTGYRVYGPAQIPIEGMCTLAHRAYGYYAYPVPTYEILTYYRNLGYSSKNYRKVHDEQ